MADAPHLRSYYMPYGSAPVLGSIKLGEWRSEEASDTYNDNRQGGYHNLYCHHLQ